MTWWWPARAGTTGLHEAPEAPEPWMSTSGGACRGPSCTTCIPCACPTPLSLMRGWCTAADHQSWTNVVVRLTSRDCHRMLSSSERSKDPRWSALQDIVRSPGGTDVPQMRSRDSGLLEHLTRPVRRVLLLGADTGWAPGLRLTRQTCEALHDERAAGAWSTHRAAPGRHGARLRAGTGADPPNHATRRDRATTAAGRQGSARRRRPRGVRAVSPRRASRYGSPRHTAGTAAAAS